MSNVIKAAVVAVLVLAQADARAESLEGQVRYAGPARPAPTLPVKHDGHVCGSSKPDEALLIDKAGGVRNAVVYLEGVANAPQPAAGTATLDQKACQFLPHVQAVPVGSTLVIGNSDNVLHNVHGFRDGETLFNLAMPAPKMTIKRKLSKPGLHFFRCDAGHTWMSSYVWTFPHPYYAVTDAAGRFTIKDVPPGKYTVRVWHEGWNRKDPHSIVTEQVKVEQQVTVEAGKSAKLSVELK